MPLVEDAAGECSGRRQLPVVAVDPGAFGARRIDRGERPLEVEGPLGGADAVSKTPVAMVNGWLLRPAAPAGTAPA
jgi:hypothetical protein